MQEYVACGIPFEERGVALKGTRFLLSAGTRQRPVCSELREKPGASALRLVEFRSNRVPMGESPAA